MNTVTATAPSRISSLSPFGIGAVTTARAAVSRQVKASFASHEAPEEVEEFGCVDWYLYPKVRGRERAGAPGAP